MNLFPGLWGQLKKREPWAIFMVAWIVLCGPITYFVVRAVH